jgi:restriction system protein
MARRRGFFAELQHQAAVAERDRQRAHAAAVRQYQADQREAERAYAAAQRAEATAARADAAARVGALREAERLHAAAQAAQVEALNSQLTSQLAEVDAVLDWTLSIDDHVDLEDLRQVVQHPVFTSTYEAPLPLPTPLTMPLEPVFEEPPAPTGLGAVFSKKKHAAAVEQSRTQFAQQHAAWRTEAAAVPMRQHEQMSQYQAADADRLRRLATDHATYEAQCRQRQEEVDAHNAHLDALISKLEAGDREVVEEYFGIVFGNSVYPDSISSSISIEHSYQPEEKELELVVGFPAPSEVPTTRAYRYVKAADEIAETSQPAKEQKDRYNKLVCSIVLRTLHEVWESDRLGHVDTIALTGGVQHLDPATGRRKTTPLVAVAVDRAEFEALDLAHVTPAETLKHLKAVVSKNPHALIPIEITSGVRG